MLILSRGNYLKRNKKETPQKGELQKSKSNSQVFSNSQVKRSVNIHKKNICVNTTALFSSGNYKVEYCGNTTVLTTTHYGKQTIQVLPQEEGKRLYVDLQTGEVKEMKDKSIYRGENLRYLKNTLSNLSKTIDANIGRYKSFLIFTLTYKVNMTDIKQLKKDFNRFWERLVYSFGSSAATDYIAAAEPQNRGAWHWHIIVFQSKKTFISKERINEIWGHGFVKTDKRKNLEQADSIGKYLSGYLSDIPFDEMENYQELLIKFFKEKKQLPIKELDNNKKIVKGARMLLYPANFQPFRFSKGIVKPTEEKKHLSFEEVQKIGFCVSKKTFFYEVNGEQKICERYFFKKKVNPKFNPIQLQSVDCKGEI